MNLHFSYCKVAAVLGRRTRQPDRRCSRRRDWQKYVAPRTQDRQFPKRPEMLGIFPTATSIKKFKLFRLFSYGRFVLLDIHEPVNQSTMYMALRILHCRSVYVASSQTGIFPPKSIQSDILPYLRSSFLSNHVDEVLGILPHGCCCRRRHPQQG